MGFGEMFMAALQGVLLLGMVLLVLALVAAVAALLFWIGMCLLALVIQVLTDNDDSTEE